MPDIQKRTIHVLGPAPYNYKDSKITDTFTSCSSMYVSVEQDTGP